MHNYILFPDMKKTFLVALSFIIFTSLTPNAQAGDCKTRDKVNWHATIKSAVFVRSDCPEGEVVGTVPGGEVVQILEVDKYAEFYLIQTSVGKGFVFSSFLTNINKSPLPGTETFEESVFVDLSPSHKYYNDIVFVKEQGIVGGTPEGKIHADDLVNRAELAKILVEATTSDEVIDNALNRPSIYSDVQPGAWYLPYLYIANQKGIMTGDSGKTTVRPADNANGAEVAKMVATAFGLEVRAAKEGEKWYTPYMDVLIGMGALPYYLPYHQVTRGEMMFMISTILRNEQALNNQWNTYTIEKFGLTFSYPNVLDITDISSHDIPIEKTGIVETIAANGSLNKRKNPTRAELYFKLTIIDRKVKEEWSKTKLIPDENIYLPKSVTVDDKYFDVYDTIGSALGYAANAYYEDENYQYKLLFSTPHYKEGFADEFVRIVQSVEIE